MQALHKEIGKRVRQLREARGLSQEALAAICNLHRTYIGLIERGERNLSISTLEVVAQGLEVPASELFVGIDTPTASGMRPKQKKTLGPADLQAHIATIRQILVEAKLADTSRYEALYRKNLKKKD